MYKWDLAWVLNTHIFFGKIKFSFEHGLFNLAVASFRVECFLSKVRLLCLTSRLKLTCFIVLKLCSGVFLVGVTANLPPALRGENLSALKYKFKYVWLTYKRLCFWAAQALRASSHRSVSHHYGCRLPFERTSACFFLSLSCVDYLNEPKLESKRAN